MTYEQMVLSKLAVLRREGVPISKFLGPLFPHQQQLTRFALDRGRAAIFADCGLGKTLIQLEWARHVHEFTKAPVLIIAPLAVQYQTLKEAMRFGYGADLFISGIRSDCGIYLCNYEKLHLIHAADFSGVVLDESSILKSFDGVTRDAIIKTFEHTVYKLACTATPAPNDYTELGNHSEFLGEMPMGTMLSSFFINDVQGESTKWRLKGHAKEAFWRWVATWARVIRSPADLGLPDDAYRLPELRHVRDVVRSNVSLAGYGFTLAAISLEDQRTVRRGTIEARCDVAISKAMGHPGSVVIWCDLNAEGDYLEKALPGALQVSGADSDEEKVRKFTAFETGAARILITKPKIAGFGMNWQHCQLAIYTAPTHSFEQFYQTVRRIWRFGQLLPCTALVVCTELDTSIVANLERKLLMAETLSSEIIKYMGVHMENQQSVPPDIQKESGDGWELYNGDCVQVISKLDSGTVDYSIFSPPFASLYTYSDSEFDMGNCRNRSEFYAQFEFLVKELFRVTAPGRLLSFHCMNLPTSKQHDGCIGITDFRGDLIRLFLDAGWIYHSEVCIWKDPVTAMQRTKAIGLLHKQLVKDSTMSRQGLPDYLITMRKPGVNQKPVSGRLDDYVGEGLVDSPDPVRKSIEIWQRYASPVWMDIRQSRTLQKDSAREELDEKHICPLQLDVIERALQLWSMPGDRVLSPFAGIGSEGYCAVHSGRRFIGVELKQSYFKQATANLRGAKRTLGFGGLTLQREGTKP